MENLKMDLVSICSGGRTLIQLSSFVHANCLLAAARSGVQFGIVTANRAIRNVFEAEGVAVHFLEVNVPRIRDVLSVRCIFEFRRATKNAAEVLMRASYKRLVLTIDCIDIPILEVLSRSQSLFDDVYLLPEGPSVELRGLSVAKMSRSELMEHIKRRVLYSLGATLKAGAGGRHAYVEIERVFRAFRGNISAPSFSGERSNEIGAAARIILLAGYSYGEDEEYFGGERYKELLSTVSNRFTVHYKMHPGVANLKCPEYEDLGMIAVESEYPIESIVSPHDLVIGNDSTAFIRLSSLGVVVVSISLIVQDLKRNVVSFGVDKKEFNEFIEGQVRGEVLKPMCTSDLVDIIERHMLRVEGQLRRQALGGATTSGLEKSSASPACAEGSQ